MTKTLLLEMGLPSILKALHAVKPYLSYMQRNGYTAGEAGFPEEDTQLTEACELFDALLNTVTGLHEFDPPKDANAGNWLYYITSMEAKQQADFVGPFMQTVRQIQLDANTTSFLTERFYQGMVLYARLLSNYGTLIALNAVRGPLSEFYKLLGAGRVNEAVSYMKEQSEAMEAATVQQYNAAADNISMTEEHIRQYCIEFGINIAKTPYSH